MIETSTQRQRVAVRQSWGTAYGWLAELVTEPEHGGEVAHVWGLPAARYARPEVRAVCGVCPDCRHLNDRPACATSL
jgi:hypothetical protein